MADYIPADVMQAELVYLLDGQRIQNVLHYDMDDPFIITDMNELAAALVAWWTATFDNWVPPTMQLVEVKVTDLRTQFAPVVYASAGLPVVGLNASPALPNNCAVVITKRTVLRGRSYRGRIYQAGLIEAQVTANQVSSAYMINYLGAWETARSLTLTSGEAYMCVISRYTNNLPRPNAEVTRVSGFTSDGFIDSQRRRLPGRGS